MAHIRIPELQRRIDTPAEISAFLARFGIVYEQWSIAAALPADPTNEQILAGYAPQIEALKTKGGYVTADVINVTPDTPNLQTMLDRFNKEHTHAEDEVRFIVKGHGVFHIHPVAGPIFSIELCAGDLINVPAGTQHWFDLCNDRTIRAIRLLKDPAGWAPQYIPGTLHEQFTPGCFGPSYVPAGARVDGLKV
jgi:1,2-dihydroxy-3-keto-5-methylthiopentene dioxygenase